MKNKLVAAILLGAGLASGARAAVYDIDPVHSGVTFKVRHLMITKVPGKFARFAGWFEYDEKNPKVWKASATIDAASIDTGIEKRDGHLRSADFLDAEKFPAIEFRSTGIEKGQTGAYKLKGELTMRGVTRPVMLQLGIGGVGNDPWGNRRAGFAAIGRINRLDFGVKWNQALEAGGVLVGEEVEVAIEVSGVRRKPEGGK